MHDARGCSGSLNVSIGEEVGQLKASRPPGGGCTPPSLLSYFSVYLCIRMRNRMLLPSGTNTRPMRESLDLLHDQTIPWDLAMTASAITQTRTTEQQRRKVDTHLVEDLEV